MSALRPQFGRSVIPSPILKAAACSGGMERQQWWKPNWPLWSDKVSFRSFIHTPISQFSRAVA